MPDKSGDNEMGRKKVSPPTKTVKIHEDVYNHAWIVAGYENKDLTVLVSELLRPIVEEMHIRHAKATVEKGEKSQAKTPKPK